MAVDTRRAQEGRISYSQCWEDPEVLQGALQVGPDDDVLSICSAGDNGFALAISGARSVTLIDHSAPQLALAELKLAAACQLGLAQFRSLLGADLLGQRVSLYHEVRPSLSAPARRWWDAHEDAIRTGLLGSGRFEKYLETFRTRVLPWVHRRSTVDVLLSLSDPAAQRAFFDERWNTWRWRGLFRMFFSKRVMAQRGRSAAQFQFVEGQVSAAFLRRAERVLTALPIATNPFVQWMLAGRYADLETTHPYLSAKGHTALAAAADRVRFVHGDLLDHLGGSAEGAYSAFNFSDVPEYLDPGAHEALLCATLDAARPGARIAYWNLLVDRCRPDSLAPRLARNPERSADLLRKDRAFVYGAFHLETVR